MVFLHRLNDGLQIFLSWRHVFQNDAVLNALAVGQGIADAERVVKPGTETVIADILRIGDIVTVFTTVLVGNFDAEHVPNNIAPVVESAFMHINTAADVFVAEPSSV